MKRIIALLITLSMLLPMAIPAFAEETASSTVVAKLSDVVSISQTGLKTSTEYSKSGSFTALLEGDSLKKATTVPVLTSDFSKATFIEFSMNSPVSTSTAFSLVLMSDNPATPSKDYYFVPIACNFQGWKLFSHRIDSLRIMGTPTGLDKIDYIQIIPGHNGGKVDLNAKLFIDDIYITSTQSDDAGKEEEGYKREPMVIYDAANDISASVVDFDGRRAFKWGPGESNLRQKQLPLIDIYSEHNMNKYQDVVIEMYSTKKTNHQFSVRFIGDDNPETSGTDAYFMKFPVDWEGEWKKVSFSITGGAEGNGNFTKSRTPLWKVNEAKTFGMYANLHGSDPFVPETEVYISKVYFDGEVQNESGEDSPTGEIIYRDRFDPETMTDYIALVKEKHPNNHHPRLLVTDEIIERINKYKDSDPIVNRNYQAVKKQADIFLTEPPPNPVGQDGNGRTTLNRRHLEDVAQYCGMMYLLTGEEKYAERIWADVLNMANCGVIWSNLATPFDSGHNANGIAIAYDWCYDYWTKDQLRFMRNTVMKNALAASVSGYYMVTRNNTTAATGKGYVTAALAIGDEPGYENFCNEVINVYVDNLDDTFLHQYLPDGNYSEGPSYWWYATESFLYTTNAMKTAMGTDFGLEDAHGIALSGDMPFALRGTTAAFNYSDSAKATMDNATAIYTYMADRYNIPQLKALYIEKNAKNPELEVIDLLWYDPEKPVQADWREGLPLEFFKSGLEELVTIRSGYEADSFYLAGKGGNTGGPHAHFESGTFVFDALGVRWVEECGADVYVYDTPRSYLYRIRTEGNNCLFVDPTRDWGESTGQVDPLHELDTPTKRIAEGASVGAAYGVLDLYEPYRESLNSYKRGFALVNNRTQMIVRDEIETKEPYEVYSFFHSLKSNKITVNPDKKSLTMSNGNGAICKVNFISDIPNFEVGVMEAEPLPSSPRPGPEHKIPHMDNSGLHKIYFRADNVTKGYITAIYTPMMEDKTPVLPENLPLDQWHKYTEEDTVLESLSVDGIPLAEFKPGVGLYKFDTEKVGVVSATAKDNIEISITQATEMGQTAYIKATNKNTGKSTEYSITFNPLAIPGLKKGMDIVSVEATSVLESQNPPEHVMDGNLATRFVSDSYDGSEKFTIDLGTTSRIVGASISFYRGDRRKNKFTLEVSEDNVNWTKVFEGFSAGTTEALETFNLIPTMGRYIRYSGYGCYAADGETQASSFNSINEIIPFGEVGDFSDTQGHWAQNEIHFSKIHNLVNGVGENIYMPENPVTRAEFITMMVRACEFSEITYIDGTFKDVSSNDWYANNIMIAKDNKIIPEEMYADGAIRPNDKLTREEMCAIATLAYISAAKRDAIKANLTSIFKDLSDGPYLSYIDQAIGLRFTNGMSADTFAPKANITRAQAATILRRVYLKIFNVNN